MQLPENPHIKLIAEQIDKNINWNFAKEPPYYSVFESTIFNKTDIAQLLRSELIKKNDQSIPSFVKELRRNLHNTVPKSIAVLCGGSGALSHQLKNVFFPEYIRIDNFDKSNNTLKEDIDSTNCFCVDLCTQSKIVSSYDIVLCLGGLRYFSTTIKTFIQNLFTLCNQQGAIFVGDNNEWLIDMFEKECRKAGFTTMRSSSWIQVFRNTFVYFLYLEYFKNRQFYRIIKKECSSKVETLNFLIRLAGFKRCEYHYCYVIR